MKIINKLVAVTALCAGLLITTAANAHGIWSKTPEDEWVKKGRAEVPKAVTSEKNFKYAVHVIGVLNGPLPLLPEQSCRAAHAQGQSDQGGCDLRAQVI